MYETELMRSILQSPMAQKMIQEISPRYGAAYVFLWLMQVTGYEWDSIKEWVEGYLLQVVPETATWALDYWEAQYKITPDPLWTIERRRENVIVRSRKVGPANPYRIRQAAEAAAGYSVRIAENTSKSHFTLYVSGPSSAETTNAIIREISQIKPAHLIFTISYERSIESTAYLASTMAKGGEITLKAL